MNQPCGLINITDRRKIELTGVKSVDSFDESIVTLTVSCGKLVVEGEGMNITVLDLDKGVICAEGIINAVVYSDAVNSVEKGLFSRIFGGKR